MATEWYRCKTWTEADQTHFFNRLHKSRESSKAQYLRIQAYELCEVGTPEAALTAISLLEFLLEKHPDRLEIAPSYDCMGRCQTVLRRWDDAIDSYRKALHYQRTFPNVRTSGHLSFAMLVACRRRTKEYDEALAFLKEWQATTVLPIEIFVQNVSCALIHEDRVEREQARVCALRALEVAKQKHSGLRYHSTLGLVTEKEADLVERMRVIAQAGMVGEQNPQIE